LTKSLEVYDHIPPSAMVIMAHPDDAEFTAAGTVARWTLGGAKVIYLLVTDGDKGTSDPSVTGVQLAETRRAEQVAACKVVGVDSVEFLHYEDGMVEPTLALRRDIARIIRKHKPYAVICPNPMLYFGGRDYVNHPDHRAVGEAALGAIYPSARDGLTFPELLAEGFEPHKVGEVFIGMGDEADVIVDITDTIGRKIESLRAHASQMGDWDPTEEMEKWAREAAADLPFSHGERYRHIRLD
jgi:LmbE family N-acetylglucosaminyl deacetylase